MRLLASVLVAAALFGTACTNSPPTPLSDPDPGSAARHVARLQAEVAEVAATHAEADHLLARALEAIRELDVVVADLRDPARVDAARERWQRTDAAFGHVEVGALRAPLLRIASQVDAARNTLLATRAEVDQDWEVAYLDAEDAALVALRDYARAADALAQVVVRHWPVYTEVHDVVEDFVETRWFYRTSREASDGFELRIRRYLEPLGRAQEDVARFRQMRQDAAAAVNAASAEVQRRWSDRPAEGEP